MLTAGGVSLTDPQVERLRHVGDEIAEGWRMSGGEPDPTYLFTAQGDLDFIAEEATKLKLDWSDPTVQSAVFTQVRAGYLDAIRYN